MENEKLKSALKESEEKKSSLQEENRELSNKFKKMEMEHKNVFYFYLPTNISFKFKNS